MVMVMYDVYVVEIVDCVLFFVDGCIVEELFCSLVVEIFVVMGCVSV